MNSNDKDELDNELIKSMKKLVEEETNVAKAFIDTQNELSDEDDELADETMGKTRVIPKVTDDMLTKVSDATINISDLNADKKLQSNKEQNNIDDTSRVKEYNKARESEPIKDYNMTKDSEKPKEHNTVRNSEKIKEYIWQNSRIRALMHIWIMVIMRKMTACRKRLRSLWMLRGKR